LIFNRLKVFEKKEDDEIQKNVLTLEDFSVKIKNIERLHLHSSTQLEIKAKLYIFLEKIIS
jgi:hypothetical protein